MFCKIILIHSIVYIYKFLNENGIKKNFIIEFSQK